MSHQYRNLPPEELELLFSNFLFDSWSFSKLSTFSRNEKAFEMSYIYRLPSKSSSSEIAGSAYHEALKFYFSEKQEGRIHNIITLQQLAYTFIDEIEADKWKLQKTTPTIAQCQIKATDVLNKLLKNFFAELSTYLDDIKTILEVETYFDEFLNVNGVDVPLPCHAKVDLVIENKEGKIILIDHKSKATFSNEEELKLSIGKQAITYVLCYEQKTGIEVDEVWFIENKFSENKDKSQQLSPYKMKMDKDVRRLYEALLYEPLKRMLEAISDPDYLYLINEQDNFTDKAELYEFWTRTMMAEIDDFNIPESKKELITKRLKKVRDTSLASVDPKIIKKFRQNASEFIQYDLSNKDMNTKEKIEHTFRTLGIIINITHIFNGYSSDTYLMEVSAGTNFSSVYKYKLDIANALNVSTVRMGKNLFVFEGKSFFSIEASKPRTKDLLYDKSLLVDRKIPVGVDNFNQTIVWDMNNPSTPHVLICGSTGSGKSVCILSILAYAQEAGMDEILIFDPKHEFTSINSASVYNDIEEIETMMEMQVEEMNALVRQGKKRNTLIIFDEFADAVAQSIKPNRLSGKKSLEENLRILLQKGRSSGYRIIAATQRASTRVITGDSKVNFPVQICFKVPKEVDSKVVLDEAGAESLSGKGDGLIKSPEYSDLIRFQAFYKP